MFFEITRAYEHVLAIKKNKKPISLGYIRKHVSTVIIEFYKLKIFCRKELAKFP